MQEDIQFSIWPFLDLFSRMNTHYTYCVNFNYFRHEIITLKETLVLLFYYEIN